MSTARARTLPPPPSREQPSHAVDRLFRQAEEAGIRLTPGMAEGLARGNPRMIAYVADLISLRGRRPAIETRHDGGAMEPGKTYTVNEHGPEAVVDWDGKVKSVGDGRPALMQPQKPAVVLPNKQAAPGSADLQSASGIPASIAKPGPAPAPTAPAAGGAPWSIAKPGPATPATGADVMARLKIGNFGGLPPAPAPAAPRDKYNQPPTPEMLQAQDTMRQIHAYQDAKSRAAAGQPTGLDKVKTAVGNAVTGTAGLVKDAVVGLGKTAGTLATVAAEPLNPYGWAEGFPLIRAAGYSTLTGLASMGASTNHYLGRYTDAGKNLQAHLDHVRAEFDKQAPGDTSTDYRGWLKEQDKTLQQHLPAWYAGVRPLDDGRATAEDRSTAGMRGFTNPENLALIKQYQQSHDPKVWHQIEHNITLTPEEMAVEQMRKEVAQSDGGQKFDKYYGKDASDNLVSTFHPVNLATTVVPVGKGIMAAKAVVNAAENGVVRTIAGNVVRSAPEAAGYGALQHIEANPQTSGADLIKGVLKNVAVNSAVVGASGAVPPVARAVGNAGGKILDASGRVLNAAGRDIHENVGAVLDALKNPHGPPALANGARPVPRRAPVAPDLPNTLQSTGEGRAVATGTGGTGRAPAPSPEGQVPEAFRDLPEPGPKGKTLYTYSYEPWKGDEMTSREWAARQWASEHAPGEWAYKMDNESKRLRWARTGHDHPFVDWRPIEGAAREQFVPAEGWGPLRMAKRAAGQYYTKQPGPLNLKTGEFTKASPQQKIANGLSNAMGTYVDPATWVAAPVAAELSRETWTDPDSKPLMDAAAAAKLKLDELHEKYFQPRK